MKYRIVTKYHETLGEVFQIQVKYDYFPFWVSFLNVKTSKKHALEAIKFYKNEEKLKKEFKPKIIEVD